MEDSAKDHSSKPTCDRNFSESKLTIDSLNDDCLIHIFELLSIVDKIKIERVCKRWRIVSLASWYNCKTLSPDKESWGLNKDKGNIVIDANAINEVLKRCGFYLKNLEFFGYIDSLLELGNNIGSMCPNLKSVYLCGVSNLTIKNLAENCTNIREFGLRDVLESCDDELSLLFAKNQNLRILKFYSVFGRCEGKFFLNLPFESLESLSIFYCDFLPHYVNQVIRNMKNLSKLSFNFCENFDDESMEAICSLTNLKEVHIGVYSAKITSCKCMTKLNNLITVELSSNSLVNNDFLLALCKNCRQLANINISQCEVSDEGVKCVTALPYLKRLNISHLQISDEAVYPMPNLKQLECFMCQKLTDKCFSMLLETSKNLELLNICSCNVTNSTVEKAIDVTKLRDNNLVLNLYVWGTKINFEKITDISPLLQILYVKRDFKAKEYL